MDKSVNILVIEDDADINGLICRILMNHGYNVRAAYSGTEAKMYLENYEYQIVLLDLMLPGMNGEELIKEIRKIKVMPIIVISAKTGQEDKINVLRLGADDFICKPFDVNELLARVEAQLRRYTEFSISKTNECKLKFKNVILDTEGRQVTVNGESIPLTYREFSILELLIRNPNKVFTRTNIFETVWDSEFLGDDNTVNVHVSNLRTKLSNADSKTEYIQTVWGIGFKLKE
jgi:DNA-binding response OmpR family regulator